MPKLVNYLNRVSVARSYDNDEIAMLQAVYDRAREALAIDVTDPRRERIAILVFQVADETADPHEIFERVVNLFQQTG